MARKLRIGNNTYSSLYRFDGGEYFAKDGATSGEAWIALMDDGTLQILFNGVHSAYDAEYEVIGDQYV